MKLSLSEIQYKCVEVVWGYSTLKQERRMKLVPAYAWQFSPRMLLFFSPCNRRVKQIMDLFRTEILICWIYFSLIKDRFVIASKKLAPKMLRYIKLVFSRKQSELIVNGFYTPLNDTYRKKKQNKQTKHNDNPDSWNDYKAEWPVRSGPSGWPGLERSTLECHEPEMEIVINIKACCPYRNPRQGPLFYF